MTPVARPVVPAVVTGLASVALLLVDVAPLAWLLMGVTAGYALSGSV